MKIETSIYEYAKGALAVSADRPAIWFCDKPMTYTQLFERIDHAADHLAELGVKEGTVVTIHLPNCPQVVIAIYAVAKLGAVCSMVHPLMPEQALRDYMAFTESRVLISYQREILERGSGDVSVYVDVASYLADFPGSQMLPDGVVSFDTLVQPGAKPADIPDQSMFSEKCAAYMHSSGSTGTPKTAMLSHRAINAWVENLKAQGGDTVLHEMVYLSISPPFHCMGFIGVVHQATAFGAQSVQLPQWNCDQAVAAIKKYGVTYITNVPSLYREMLRHPEFCGAGISQMTHCMIGGELVPPELINQIDERIGNGRVARTAFGSTEVGGAFCGLFLPEHNIAASGYALKGARIRVQDAASGIKEVGQGELLVHSESVMMGYLKDPETTAACFVTHEGCQWLKTGDYGRIDEDGAVYYISRVKDIVIRKGHNVFPTEVELAIRSVPEVADVCVFGTADEENATETVCAALVPAVEMDADALRARVLEKCAAALARYAVPGKILILPELPRTNTGKADKNALRKLL